MLKAEDSWCKKRPHTFDWKMKIKIKKNKKRTQKEKGDSTLKGWKVEKSYHYLKFPNWTKYMWIQYNHLWWHWSIKKEIRKMYIKMGEIKDTKQKLMQIGSESLKFSVVKWYAFKNNFKIHK